MRLHFWTALIIICILGCRTDQGERTVTLFNDIAFELRDGEQIVPTEEEDKELYLTTISPYPFQIPLYKAIESKKYSMYLGIPFQTNIDEISRHTLSKTDSISLSKRLDSSDHIYREYRTSDQYIAEYVRKISDNLIYVLATTTSEEISKKAFRRKNFSNRFAENTK